MHIIPISAIIWHVPSHTYFSQYTQLSCCLSYTAPILTEYIPDLASSHSTKCVNESQLDIQISRSIHILVTFLHHLSNSLIQTKRKKQTIFTCIHLLNMLPKKVLLGA